MWVNLRLKLVADREPAEAGREGGAITVPHTDRGSLELAVSPGGGTTTPGGRSQGSNRVIRGGIWNNHGQNCRAANRNRNTPTNRNNNLGFRVARAPRVECLLCRTEPTALQFRFSFGRRTNVPPGPPG